MATGDNHSKSKWERISDKLTYVTVNLGWIEDELMLFRMFLQRSDSIGKTWIGNLWEIICCCRLGASVVIRVVILVLSIRAAESCLQYSPCLPHITVDGHDVSAAWATFSHSGFFGVFLLWLANKGPWLHIIFSLTSVRGHMVIYRKMQCGRH